MRRLREGTAALVVPAFEYVKQEDGTDQRVFPADKQVSAYSGPSPPPRARAPRWECGAAR